MVNPTVITPGRNSINLDSADMDALSDGDSSLDSVRGIVGGGNPGIPAVHVPVTSARNPTNPNQNAIV